MNPLATENLAVNAPGAPLGPVQRFLKLCYAQNKPVRTVLLALLVIQAVVITWMCVAAVYGIVQSFIA